MENKKSSKRDKTKTKKARLPFSNDVTDVGSSVKINFLIIKICRLDFNRQKAEYIKSIKELIHLGRGDKRTDFRQLMVNESHIIGEIFLGLIRFIHNYINSVSVKLFCNGVRLISFLSFYFKIPDNLAIYTLRKFNELNYNIIKSKDEF